MPPLPYSLSPIPYNLCAGRSRLPSVPPSVSKGFIDEIPPSKVYYPFPRLGPGGSTYIQSYSFFLPPMELPLTPWSFLFLPQIVSLSTCFPQLFLRSPSSTFAVQGLWVIRGCFKLFLFLVPSFSQSVNDPLTVSPLAASRRVIFSLTKSFFFLADSCFPRAIFFSSRTTQRNPLPCRHVPFSPKLVFYF